MNKGFGVAVPVPVHSCIACPEGRGCCLCNGHKHPRREPPPQDLFTTSLGGGVSPAWNPAWNITSGESDIYTRNGKPYIMIDGEEFELHASPSEPEPEQPTRPEPQEANLWDHLKDD
jgi:hypothetical protein